MATETPTPRHRGPALVVGSREGGVAVVRVQTGACLWRQQTDRRVQTLAQDGERFYLSLGESLSLRRQRHRPLSDEQLIERLEEDAIIPLTCRRLEDGALLWRYTDWSLSGYVQLAVEGNTVLAGANAPPRSAEAAPSIYALDIVSGRVLWTTPARLPGRPYDSLVGAGGGRVFVRGASIPRRMQALEARTGHELWSSDRSVSTPSFPGGVLCAQRSANAEDSMLTVLRAEDGTQFCQIPLLGRLQALTDDGVAYVAITEASQGWVAAVDAAGGGRELWRTEGVDAYRVAVDGSHLYYACLRPDLRVLPRQPVALAEVGALDAQTGRQLWTWHSPRDTGELLRLWGARTPAMLVDSAKKSWETIMTRVHGNYRSRRHALRGELRMGQWRHPYTLHQGGLNLEARDGLVFVGTRLGLFALDGDTGTLRWHALPDLDLSFVEPALPPL
jgi:outer membrane protein assembly factor BamB